MRRLHERLHVVERPFRFRGVEIGTRATVIALAGGGVLVHSPVRLDDEIRAALQPHGPVRHLVAPTRTHHLALAAWANAYPDALLHGAPGLAEKRPDLRFASELGDAPAPAWAADVDQALLRGAPRYHEVAFLHRPSRTLILADSLFGWGPEHPPLTRIVARLQGMYGRWRRPHNAVFGAYEDGRALRASIDRILSWDFERIVICHGTIVERDGPAVLRAAYAWLRPA